VLYQHDNLLYHYGVFLVSNTEQQERLMEYLQLKPVLPKTVATTIQLATELLGEGSLDEFKSKGVELYLDKNGQLHLASSWEPGS